MRTHLVGGTVYTPDEVIEKGSVVSEGGKILAVGTASPVLSEDGQVVDVSGLKVVPGLIDLHIHGLEGFDVMDGAAGEIARRAVRSGVTSFLATTMTTSIDELKAVLRQLPREHDPNGAEILGFHLEGPYLSPKQAGVMEASQIRAFDWNELQGLIEAGQGMVRMVTLAPEIEGATAAIGPLARQGVVVSMGHSHATFAEVEAAVAAGLRHATHVFNAMRGFHHREPGTVGGVLHFPEIVAQFIADGQHLHKGTVELLIKTKGVDGLALISDATPLAGLAPGEYRWRSLTLEVREGRAEDKRNGGLGGSVKMMNHGLKWLMDNTGLSFADALRTATLTPARVLGLSQRKGRLAPGWDADVAVFDDDYRCRLAMVGGRIVYRATLT